MPARVIHDGDRNRDPGADGLLASPLDTLRFIGRRRAADLAHAGLRTVEDLLCRLPFRYEDRRSPRPIGAVELGETALLSGVIVDGGVRYTRRSTFKIFQATLSDGSGTLQLAWPNQPYLQTVIRVGQRLFAYGTIGEWRGRLQLLSPDYELVEAGAGDPIHTGRIVPVYQRAGSVTPKLQRRIVFGLLQQLPSDLDDPLPGELLARLSLPARRQALVEAHFPPPERSADVLNRFRTPAQVRLIFEEFFLFQVGLALRRRRWSSEVKPFVPTVDDRIRESARRVLPFALTPGQRQALREIVEDLQRPRPMNRLLQGDVGAGKTIVALLAALVAMENGLQVAFMAPTEILAEQHAATIRRLLEPSPYRVGLLTGAAGASSRRARLDEIGHGRANLVVGTHALVEGDVTFDRLGLVIIDEQHRFGVLQRAALRAKGLRPDVLVMTATPIPRTLALTLFGDLDVSTIRDRPPGRQAVATALEPAAAREDVYQSVRRELEAGRQAYVVYPLVEESSKVDLRAATAMADHLASDVFPAWRVGLLHGRMPADAKDAVMRRFAAGEIDVLVATTVVEVGIDVPNATVMIVEHAERFGLAQLHQLRGRVGRGPERSRCVLLYQEPLSAEAAERLGAMAATDDGFVIAERDLALRGPGDLSGLCQAGLPTLRVGDLQRDREIMELAWQMAAPWAARDDGPAARLRGLVERTWADRFGLVGIG